MICLLIKYKRNSTSYKINNYKNIPFICVKKRKIPPVIYSLKEASYLDLDRD